MWFISSNGVQDVLFWCFTFHLLKRLCILQQLSWKVDLFRNTGVQYVTSSSSVYCLVVNLVLAWITDNEEQLAALLTNQIADLSYSVKCCSMCVATYPGFFFKCRWYLSSPFSDSFFYTDNCASTNWNLEDGLRFVLMPLKGG